ncbi:hypothetical protein BBR01nite_04890 [Brevibacillus brevis]|nr:hypothetical protein BBR01nite_04890 [Brevibacillus brevis]
MPWPYLSANLQEWDHTVPDGCNYSLLLISDFPLIDYEQDKYNPDFVISVLIPKYVAVLRKVAGEVYYHSGNHHAEYVKKLLTPPLLRQLRSRAQSPLTSLLSLQFIQ